MSLGRRKIHVSDQAAWVFNRMADVYDSRPPYPARLLDALNELAGGPRARVADLGAGTGHVALPLAERGLEVVAVEPARAMLERLIARASARGLQVAAVHAAAEALPLAPASFELVLVADALHFMDKERAALEIARVLSPRGALGLVTSEFGDTPFMRGVRRIMEESAPRRPRDVLPAVVQVAKVARVALGAERRFHDETPLAPAALTRVLRSISFIGPAMNPERFATFLSRIRALPYEPVWARTFVLRAGRR